MEERKRRPTDYKPEYCEKLVKHMADGWSFESFGAEVGCGKNTLYEWRRANPEFDDAFNEGRSKHLKWMEKRARDGFVENFQGPKVNTALFKLFMANVHGWRDQQDVQATIVTAPKVAYVPKSKRGKEEESNG